MYRITVIIILFQTISPACLPETTLKNLGFTTVKTSPEKITGAKYCKEEIAANGTCVAVDEINAVVEARLSTFRTLMEKKQNVDNIFNLFKDRVSGTQLDQVNTVRENFNNGQAKCRESIEKIKAGVVCSLISGTASTYTTVSGNNLTVKVDKNTTGVELENCINYYDGLCLL